MHKPFRARGKRECGAVMAETSITFLVFILFVLIGIETVRMSFLVLSGEYLVGSTARWAMLGTADATMIEERLISEARPFGFDLSPDDVHICLATSPGCPVDQTPNPNALFTVSFDYSVNMIVPVKSFDWNFRAFAKAER